MEMRDCLPDEDVCLSYSYEIDRIHKRVTRVHKACHKSSECSSSENKLKELKTATDNLKRYKERGKKFTYEVSVL